MRAKLAAITQATPLSFNAALLTRRAISRVFVGNNDVAWLYVLYELGVDVFHRVRYEFLGVSNVEVAGGNNNVGVDVIAILENKLP